MISALATIVLTIAAIMLLIVAVFLTRALVLVLVLMIALSLLLELVTTSKTRLVGDSLVSCVLFRSHVCRARSSME